MRLHDLLDKAHITAQKLLHYSREDIDIRDFTTVHRQDVHVVGEPYPHVVIENIFKPNIYERLCERFETVRQRGLSKNVGRSDGFHAFDMDYDGYLFVPRPTLLPEDPLRLFFSLEWNRFFSKMFHQYTSFETSLAFHHHPVGDRTGFVHNDFVNKLFMPSETLENGVPWREYSRGPLSRRRAVSLLYFLKNDKWKQGDGGEIGIYSADQKTLIKKIPPKNNTLFAFQISPKSMHAFQMNKTERNSLVQWFHTPVFQN